MFLDFDPASVCSVHDRVSEGGVVLSPALCFGRSQLQDVSLKQSEGTPDGFACWCSQH